MPAGDVRQHAHLVVPVGDRRSQRQLAPREVERLAVEQHPVKHAGRAVERAGAELRVGLAGGGAVRHREQRVAEVDQQDRVVVGLGRHPAALEEVFGHPDP